MALHQRLARRELRVLRRLLGPRPLPLWWWRLRHRFHAALSPAAGLPLSTEGRATIPAELRALLVHASVGQWALEATVLHLLWADLLERRPALLLEFGAGTSTLMLSRYCAAHGPPGARVISIEQSAEVAQHARACASEQGVGGPLTVLTVGLDSAGGYMLEGVPELLEVKGRADWALIDGPAGPDGCRGPLLGFLAEHLADGGRWFLDDACRGPELDFLHRSSSDPRLVIEGILPVAQGLCRGLVVSGAASPPVR